MDIQTLIFWFSKVLIGLCENCPNQMRKHAVVSRDGVDGWITPMVHRFVGKGSVRSSLARKLFHQGFILLGSISADEELKIATKTKEILEDGLLDTLSHTIKDPSPQQATQVELMKVWGYLLLLLKEKTLFKDPKFLNKLLAIMTTALIHKSVEIQLQGYESWRFFLCVLTTNTAKLIRHKKRLQIALSPLTRA